MSTSVLSDQLRKKVETLCGNTEKAFTEAVVEAVTVAVEHTHGWPDKWRAVYREILKKIADMPSENWDDLGSEIISQFAESVRFVTNLRSEAVKIHETHGCRIKNSERLDGDIQQLNELKKELLESWPWSNQDLPPTDRNMVEASMAALARGEQGEAIEDLIVRLSGTQK